MRTSKSTVEEAGRIAQRKSQLACVHEAIRQGRAFLDTAWGRMNVTGYNDDTGWAITDRGRSFMVCLDAIKIDWMP